jgi:type IV pilus assembly protein PilQ
VLALNPKVNTDVELVPYATLSDFNMNGNLQDTFNISLPQYRTDELATRMVVKSGETVVMGGVLARERTTFVESIPVLGNLPVVGVFFRRRTEVDTPRYLLVFVTATIVKDTGEFLSYEDLAAATNNPAATNLLRGRLPALEVPPATTPVPAISVSNAPPANAAATNAPATAAPAANTPGATPPAAGGASTNAPAGAAASPAPAPGTNAAPAAPAPPAPAPGPPLVPVPAPPGSAKPAPK